MQNLTIMNCLSSNLNKILATATILSLLSLTVIIYNIDRILSSDNIKTRTAEYTNNNTITDGFMLDYKQNENPHIRHN